MRDLTGLAIVASRAAGRAQCQKVEISFDRATWTDVSDRLLPGMSILSDSARDENAPNEKRASIVGHSTMDECSVNLRNGDRELTPWNTAGAYYSAIKHRLWKRLPIRVSQGFKNSAGVCEYVYTFKGYIEEWNLSVGQGGGVVSLRCLDAGCRLSGFKVRSALYHNVRTDEALTTLVGLIPSALRPTVLGGTLSVESGTEIIEWWYADSENWMAEASRIARLEGGTSRLYFSPAGTVEYLLRFEAAGHLLTSGHATAVATFTIDSFEKLAGTGKWTDFCNAVQMRYRSRRLAPTTEVWSAPNRYSVKAGATLDVLATFRDPVYELSAPLYEIDFVPVTPGGRKLDEDAGVTVTVAANETWAQQAIVTITNGSALNVRLPKLQLRGKALIEGDEEEVVLGLLDDGTYVTDLTGQTVDAGWTVKRIEADDNPLVMTRAQALRQCRLVLDRLGPIPSGLMTAYPDAVTRMEFTLDLPQFWPELEHGDRVHVTEVGGSLASDFYITRVEHKSDASICTTLGITPAAGLIGFSDPFILGTNTLGNASETPGRYVW